MTNLRRGRIIEEFFIVLGLYWLWQYCLNLSAIYEMATQMDYYVLKIAGWKYKLHVLFFVSNNNIFEKCGSFFVSWSNQSIITKEFSSNSLCSKIELKPGLRNSKIKMGFMPLAEFLCIFRIYTGIITINYKNIVLISGIEHCNHSKHKTKIHLFLFVFYGFLLRNVRRE